MGRTQKLAAIIKEGVRNPQKIKKGLKVLKNQGPEIFKQRLSASVNYEPGYGRVKKEKLKNYSGEILFSIVMPVYNVEIKWLDKAIESIEKQNYKNWEICIADDCSTKQEVREHLSAMKNSRIKIKLLEKLNLDRYPICVSKTPMSISDNKELLGYPKDYTMQVTDIKLNNGAGFIVIYMGNVITLPGLSKESNY